MNKTLLNVSLLLFCLNVFAQKNVNHIYTNFGGWWSTGVAPAMSPVKPNGPHNLLAFRVVGSTTVFSTGVNNTLLSTQGVTFEPTNFQALPVRSLGGNPTSNTFIGLGKNYFNPATPITGGTLTNSIPFYLTDGANGLDLGSAIYNAQVSNLEYRVSLFNTAAINDGIPDVLATQMGDYTAGFTEIFKFVDADGNTVGQQIVVNFGAVAAVGEQSWAFYTASNRQYTSNPTGDRFTRLLTWDLHDFQLTDANVGSVDRFIHILSGVSDQAFTAHNTNSFSAESDISACDDIKPSLWLQADYGTDSTVNNAQIGNWENRVSGNITNFVQTTNSKKPIFNTGNNTTGFNFNPHLSFTNQWMAYAGSPFTTADENLDIFVVTKKKTTGVGGNILGVSADNTLAQNRPSIGWNSTGNFIFRVDATTIPVPLATPSKPSLIRMSYTRNDAFSSTDNGNPAPATPGPYVFDLGNWYTHLGGNVSGTGDATNNFDLAEILVFPKNSTSVERSKIRTSLAIKYGLTLPYNYIAGNGDVIWRRDLHTYNNRILGIGSESCFALLQKQSQSEDDPLKLLQVSRGTLAVSNKLNTSTIANGEYLVFGDDNGSIATTNKRSVKGRCLINTNRVWRNQRTGTTINTQSTQVKIRVNQINWGITPSTNPSNYFLIIDRNANNSFNDAADSIITASSIDAQGYAIFNNVVWDTDGSGVDLFTVGIKSNTPCSIISNPMIRPRTKK